ncbi:MAG: T9SS type A sorting domain-containing protein [bacterium]|nr:T9SS type A sorting domain-containing protein [bacterium]
MSFRGTGKLCLALLLLFVMAPQMAAALSPDSSYHEDHRQTPRLQFDPVWQNRADLAGAELADAFVISEAAAYGIRDYSTELELVRVQESQVGTHYHYRQVFEGIEVLHGELIVSVAHASNRIYQVYNNVYPVGNLTRATAAMTSDDAYDIAWNHLRSQGDLLSEPSIKLAWIPSGADFNLSYIAHLELAVPYGGWRLEVDANSGEIHKIEDARYYRVRDDLTETPISERIHAHAGATADRRAAFTRFQARNTTVDDRDGVRAEGTGKVFDPDPRTTLNNSALQNTTSASLFTAAYFDRPLRDITYSGGNYILTGPWVRIINWDSPHTSPSTTTDGIWSATRGNNSFNDAMTYYMIDMSQRYIQDLGFTGATGIQEGSIQADADGCGGADNSYYIPSTNRLAFGHGCVDDNEDADVILHEYGHAIHRSINSNWGGGHTGAIGEGFGDYWAGSYSYSTPNGPTFHPEWIFSWDGHGNGNQCWYGRYMNKVNLRYNHSASYSAHQSISGGQSDELWSTPLFQSLIALIAAGESRESVDRIVLESHFGIGYGPRMRDLANATVAAALALEPTGQHAAIFRSKFAVHEIIDNLTAVDDVQPPAPLTLARNYPNPFNPSTEIIFAVNGNGMKISLEIFDVAGRKVRTLVDGFQTPGQHKIVWQGDDDAGKPVVSGVYFYRLEGDDFRETRKMMLLK